MPLEKQLIICELCRKTFKPTGIGPHQKLGMKTLHLQRTSIQVNLNDDGSNVDNSGDRHPAPAPVSDPDIHNIDDIQVEYHLNSGKPMNTQRFSKFTWGHIHGHKEWFTLKDYNNLHSQFIKDVISVQPADDPELETFLVYHWSLWDWACDLLKDPHVGLNFVFDAQHLSKFDGTSFVCFIDEPWTANKFWNVQSKIPSDGKALKGYPVVAHLANLPTWIWNSEGIGGGHVVGWLPIVKEEKRCNGKLWFVNFKNVVWHESTKKLFTMIAVHLKTGCWVKCWDDINHCFFPLILILSVDYEEQVIMALICGAMSNFPCPKYLCELCTSENVVKTLEEARSQRLADNKKAILAAQGLHDVDNTFQIIDNMDVYQALSWDGLHTNSAGEFGDHLWTELQKVLKKEGWNAMAMVEKNLCEMPCWHALNHFDEGLSVLYTDSQKHEDLSKVCVQLIYCVFVNLLCLGQRYAEKTANIFKKNWNFPKNHLGIHVFNDIKAKGVMCNFNTKPNEKMHGPIKEAYQRQTNFKNIAEQILNIDHWLLTAEYIHCRIEDYDNYTSTMRGDEATDGVDNDANEYYFHVWLECQFLQVNFESMVDWCQYTNYFHCNPTFHGWPHYDCVIIKTYQGHIFGQLVFLFKCTVSREEFPLALIQPYDAPIEQWLSKDKHLNFWRVQEQPCTLTEFFLVQLIIHGALLYLDNSRPGNYLVVDTIDTDMFLCIQAMHQVAGHLS
ncbi:hypothetical protein J3A83DRAFT_4364795 [Scleroderma citrinum]